MPLPFIGRKKKPVRAAPQRVRIPPDQIDVNTLSIKFQYYSMSSHGVRTPAAHDIPERLPALLAGFAHSPVELIEPLPIDFEDAAPSLVRPEAALQWINAHHGRSPLGRQALFVFEQLDVVDLAYETFALALLHGELDVPAVCARLGMSANMVYKARSRLLSRTRDLVDREEAR